LFAKYGEKVKKMKQNKQILYKRLAVMNNYILEDGAEVMGDEIAGEMIKEQEAEPYFVEGRGDIDGL